MTVRRYTSISDFDTAWEFIEYTTQFLTRQELASNSRERLADYHNDQPGEYYLEIAVGASYVLLILEGLVA